MTADRAVHDLRLVPAALLVWLGTLVALLAGWWLVLLASGAAAVLSLALLMFCRGPRLRSASWVLLVFAGLLAVLVTPRLRGAEKDELRFWADRGAAAVLRVTLTERPKPVRSAGYAGRAGGTRTAVVPAEIEEVVIEGQRLVTSARVVLLAQWQDWAELLPGQEVTVNGTLAPGRPTELTVAAVRVRGPPREVGGAPWWERGAADMRGGLREATEVLDEEEAGLLPGLVVGDTTRLSPRVADEFEDAGLSHLNAVSGANLTIVCGAVLLLMRLVRLGPGVSAMAAGAALAGFMVLAGPEPSVLRAGVMGAVGLLALALGRRGSAVPALAAAVAGLVLYDPAMAASYGFALSVVATAGLVLLAPLWAAGLSRRGVPVAVAGWLVVPLAAFAVTAPIVAGMSGEVSSVAVVANVLAAPVVAPATVLGVLATVTATVWPGGAEFLVRLAGPEASWLIVVARKASAVPGAVLDWPSGWAGGVLAVVVLLTLAVLLRWGRARVALAVVLVCVLLVALPARVLLPPWPPPGWAVVSCDVGQGDALALSTGEPGRAVVVDTGPEPGPVDRCLDRLGVERVPMLVLSHLHADHVGGLESVFEGRSVGGVVVGPGRAPRWAWEQVEKVTAAHGVPLLELTAGQRLDWPGLALEVLGPRSVPRTSVGAKGKEVDGTTVNNSSLVVRAQTAAGRILLTGDVELGAQADLLSSGEDLAAEILKVPHHGSKYVLGPFLAAVGPRLAMVSAGADNSYGHPHQSTMDKLTTGGALITRTDTDGDVAAVPDAVSGIAAVRRGKREKGVLMAG